MPAAGYMPGGLDVDVQPIDDLITAAGRRERLSCGCDARQLLHDMLGPAGFTAR